MWPKYCEDIILFTTKWWTELRVADPAPLCLQRPRLWRSYVTDKISLYRYSNVLNCQCAISLQIISFCFINTLNFFTEVDEGTWGNMREREGTRGKVLELPTHPKGIKTKQSLTKQNKMWNRLKWRDGEGWVTSDPKVETCDVVTWRCAVVTPVDLPVLATELLACQSHPQTICGSHGVTTPVSVEQTLQQKINKKMAKQQKEQKTPPTHTNTILFGRFCVSTCSPTCHHQSICAPSVHHPTETGRPKGGNDSGANESPFAPLAHLPI